MGPWLVGVRKLFLLRLRKHWQFCLWCSCIVIRVREAIRLWRFRRWDRKLRHLSVWVRFKQRHNLRVRLGVNERYYLRVRTVSLRTVSVWAVHVRETCRRFSVRAACFRHLCIRAARTGRHHLCVWDSRIGHDNVSVWCSRIGYDNVSVWCSCGRYDDICVWHACPRPHDIGIWSGCAGHLRVRKASRRPYYLCIRATCIWIDHLCLRPTRRRRDNVCLRSTRRWRNSVCVQPASLGHHDLSIRSTCVRSVSLRQTCWGYVRLRATVDKHNVGIRPTRAGEHYLCFRTAC